MTKSKLQITLDGSHTLISNFEGETYHSSFGAIQESQHIFIKHGLAQVHDYMKRVKILEVGTGTGLNVLLSYLWSEDNDVSIEYKGFEPFPLQENEVADLNYPKLLSIKNEIFSLIHSNKNKEIVLSNMFTLKICMSQIQKAQLRDNYYNLVFFDAFSPDAQPELWTTQVFTKIFKSLASGGILTTYSCKGSVKRSMQEAGFDIEKVPGPPGKREFLRATKG
ncbi:MAG: tRNA (5-methylaminomethyl-2-thiouridine)(34)-methyltransferase MnmD [Bacteroidetes bacterium]|nr:tRNA (5-methylaminomethyl-2-thiouridine)(34)-methyltransferase MnmD [Bacteroidota bacterium]